MKSMQILALGSPFGLDRAAWMIARALKYNQAFKDIQIHVLDRPNTGLITYLNNKATLILDAVMTDGKFGEVTEFKITAKSIEKISLLQQRSVSSHALGLAQSLDLALSLNQIPKQCFFVGFNINQSIPSKIQLKHFRNFRQCVTRFIAS